MAEDMGEKTEMPTPKRLAEARNKGQTAKSQDLGGAIGLAAATVLCVAFGAHLMRTFHTLMGKTLGDDAVTPLSDLGGMEAALRWTLGQGLIAAVPILVIAFLVAYVGQLIQVGLLFTLKPIKPDLNRMNPVAGLKKLFNKRNLVKTVVNTLKLVVVLVVAFLVLSTRIQAVLSLPALTAGQAAMEVLELALIVAVWLVLVLLLLAVLDFIYQRWQHQQDLKMTKFQVKDERRSHEGDPETKKRRFQMAAEIAMQRARAGVPTADVVVTNPTHFSVAIKYDGERMNAPRVIAKGVDHMALQIRSIARTSSVPIVERPPLARALYWGVEEGEEVPPEMYEAVAEVLAFVYRLNNEQAA